MKKAFTLAEALVTMAIIGIVMALSIPAVIQSTNDTRPLFKKAYSTVETVVNELVNDTSLYPSGDLSSPSSGTSQFDADCSLAEFSANDPGKLIASNPTATKDAIYRNLGFTDRLASFIAP